MRLLSSHIRLPSRRQARLFWQSFLITALFIGFLSGFFYVAYHGDSVQEPALSVVLPSSSRLAEDGKRHLSGGTDAFSLSFLGWKMEISSGELRQIQQTASRLYRQYGVLIPAGWRAAGESIWLLWQGLGGG